MFFVSKARIVTSLCQRKVQHTHLVHISIFQSTDNVSQVVCAIDNMQQLCTQLQNSNSAADSDLAGSRAHAPYYEMAMLMKLLVATPEKVGRACSSLAPGGTVSLAGPEPHTCTVPSTAPP